MKLSHKHALLKTISWRIFATVTTALFVFFFTDSLVIALSIGTIDGLFKTVIYYGHERMWSRWNF